MLVNLHGPHSQHHPSDIQGWWSNVGAIIRGLLVGDQLILGGDLNARVGPSEICTGAHGPDCTNEAGRCVIDLCQDLGLVLANTYEEVMRDHPAETWRDRRLDYVAVPSCCLGACQVVSPDFDLLNPHEDHRALCLDLSVWVRDSSPVPPCPSKKGRAGASSRLLAGRDEHTAMHVLGQLASRSKPWNENVHTHANFIFCDAQSLLEEAAVRKSQPHKPFTSCETMHFIQQRKQCDKALRHLDEHERTLLLAQVFHAWRGRGPPASSLSEGGLRTVRFGKAACIRARALWCNCVRRQLRIDKALYVEQLCRELGGAADRRDCAALFAALRYRPASKRVFKPFGPIDVLRGPDGSIAGSFEEQQAIRGQHFGAMEAAVEQTAREFAAQDQPPAVPVASFQLCHLPSVLDVEKAVRGLPRRKATGPSGVPNEVWRASPSLAARMWLPVMLRQNVRLTEPVRFSTGILATLFKGKGDPSCVEAHRSIFLLEGIGKACRKMIRLPLLKALRQASPELFEGCQPRSSSEVLTHYVTSFRDLRALKGWSTACIFLDLSSAYYNRVTRAKITGEEWSDASICSVLAQMGVSPELFHSIRKWLHGGAVASKLERHHRDILRAAFRSSGFLLRNRPSVYRTRSGTRPGDSIADTLFALVFAEAMQRLRINLSQAGLLQDVNGDKPAFPVWADDSVLPLAFESASDLCEALPFIASIVHRTFEARAMALNYGPGKTEALLRLSGPNSAKLRKQLLGRARKVPFAGSQGDTHELRLCQRYVHLGTVISERSGPMHDLRAKVARAKQAVYPLAPKVLREHRIAWQARRHVLEALGISAALHNTGIWHISTAEEARLWERGIVDLYRLTLQADGHTGHPAYPCAYFASGGLPECRLRECCL